jgi:hypothetical protein
MGFRTLKLAHEDFTRILEGGKNGKWVGRVYKTEKGWGARIGQGGDATIVDGYPTSTEAFYQCTSRRLGYENLEIRNEEIRAHNKVVRAKRKEARAKAAYAVDQLVNHRNFEPFGKILDEALGKKGE